MRSRIRRALSRAKLAAVGGAVGAAVGGLVSRNAASSGAAVGALAGATVADLRSDPDGFLPMFRSDDADGDEADAVDDGDEAGDGPETIAVGE
jgi:outer membrane lipoprotein SlyB